MKKKINQCSDTKIIMKRKVSKKIFVITYSNMDDLSYGNSNNDNKFITSIPSYFNIKKIFPYRNEYGTISFLNIIKFLLKITKLSIKRKQIFIIRGTKLAFIPIIFKHLTKNVIILNMGCTPLPTVEKRAFLKNFSNSFKPKFINQILSSIEFQFEKLLLRNSDKFFVENTKAKKLIIYFGAPPSKVCILPYYVQDYFMEENNLEYHYGDEFILGYTGRFHSYDDLPLVIGSIHKLREKDINFKLILIGDGQTKIKIKQLVKKKELSNYVEFLGSKPHKEIPGLLNKIHCLFVPMYKYLNPSTIPIKILEGIIKGKIIITNNSGNIKSLFNPYNNLVFNELDSNNLANDIIDIMRNYNFYTKRALEIRERHLKFRTQQNFSQIMKNSLNKTLKMS